MVQRACLAVGISFFPCLLPSFLLQSIIYFLQCPFFVEGAMIFDLCRRCRCSYHHSVVIEGAHLHEH